MNAPVERIFAEIGLPRGQPVWMRVDCQMTAAGRKRTICFRGEYLEKQTLTSGRRFSSF